MVDSSATNSVTAKRPATISGRVVALGLLATLLIVSGLVGWVSLAYGEFSHARRQADLNWRSLADLLETRYRKLDKLVAERVDSRQIDMTFGEKWRSARAGFTGSIGVERQAALAQELETLLSSLPDLDREQFATVAPSTSQSEFSTKLQEYEVWVQAEERELQKPAMKLLRQLLVIRDPLNLKFAF